MKIDNARDCTFLNQKCMYAGYKCSECPLTDIWCDTMEEVVDYLNSIPKIVMNQTGNNCVQIGSVKTLNI